MNYGKDDELSRFDDDLEVTPAEAAEAEALARVLEGKSGVQLPNAVSEAVGLLRVAAHDDLSETALARIEAELMAQHAPRKATQRQRGWWWLALAALAPATVVVYLVNGAREDSGAVLVMSPSVPVPEVRVLQAQASWIVSDAERGAFEREMEEYRSQILASLDVH